VARYFGRVEWHGRVTTLNISDLDATDWVGVYPDGPPVGERAELRRVECVLLDGDRAGDSATSNRILRTVDDRPAVVFVGDAPFAESSPGSGIAAATERIERFEARQRASERRAMAYEWELRGSLVTAAPVVRLLRRAPWRWVDRVVPRTSMAQLFFTAVGDEYPFDYSVAVQWIGPPESAFDFVLEGRERGEIARRRCGEVEGLDVLEEFLTALCDARSP
jgi:hypothetical protein